MWGKQASGGSAAVLVLALALALGCSGRQAARVVSLSRATTQVATALGAADRIASLDPSAADSLPRALEAHADAVIAEEDSHSSALRAAFAAQNVTVKTFAPKTQDEVFEAYREIARLLGDPKAADTLIAQVNHDLAELARGTPADGRPTIALVLSRDPLRVVAGGAFLSKLIEAAGAENVFAGEPGAAVIVRAEQIDELAPDHVLEAAPSAFTDAWVDPVGSARTLRETLLHAAP
jgi:ABC-type Fe3+-hydroxamate transport system substrate-binding protein